MEQITLSLEFTVDDFSYEDIKDKRFAKGIIHAFADGENANTWPIDTAVLADCANSVYDIPVVCKYNGFVNDFMSHERDEVPIGFIKETSPTYSNPIVFEKNPDGRLFIVIKCLIWKKYAKNALEVFKRSQGKKSVSVELTVTKGEEIDGKIRVDEYVLEGITVLGDYVTPAVKDARIQVEFAKDKADYLNSIGFSDNNNDTEAGEKNMTENENTQDCAVVENEATPTCEGTCAADGCANCAEGEGVCASSEGEACAESNEEMSKELPVYNYEADGETVTCEDNENKDEEPESEPEKEPENEDEEDKGEDAEGEEVEESKEENKEEFAALEAAMSKVSELTSRVEELEAQNSAYMAQIAEMSDYSELKQYKAEMSAKIKQESDMAIMNSVMSDIAARGYDMSEAEKNELFAKFADFDSADAWSNYVKAQAFDKVENAGNSVQRIGLPYANVAKSNSIWDLI